VEYFSDFLFSWFPFYFLAKVIWWAFRHKIEQHGWVFEPEITRHFWLQFATWSWAMLSKM
jgi:hypothetical protein